MILSIFWANFWPPQFRRAEKRGWVTHSFSAESIPCSALCISFKYIAHGQIFAHKYEAGATLLRQQSRRKPYLRKGDISVVKYLGKYLSV